MESIILEFCILFQLTPKCMLSLGKTMQIRMAQEVLHSLFLLKSSEVTDCIRLFRVFCWFQWFFLLWCRNYDSDISPNPEKHHSITWLALTMTLSRSDSPPWPGAAHTADSCVRHASVCISYEPVVMCLARLQFPGRCCWLGPPGRLTGAVGRFWSPLTPRSASGE